MRGTIAGIHHITAISGDPRKNIDFYRAVLGLRMVKRTVNFDDPYTYHFYYGDALGHPGTILTFFPWGLQGLRGRRGTGQVTTTSFAVPQDALAFWKNRLEKRKIAVAGPFERFGQPVLTLEDPDGLDIELVGVSSATGPGWHTPEIPTGQAIRGFHSATLLLADYRPTLRMMTDLLGFRRVGETENRLRLTAGGDGPGAQVDLVVSPDSRRGTMGVGTVHHIAWRVADEATQLDMRERLLSAGYQVTPVRDRQYFRSIYFREPGGVLFEIATDGPGFATDETPETLGTSLRLPPWLESRRAEIERRLPPISTD